MFSLLLLRSREAREVENEIIEPPSNLPLSRSVTLDVAVVSALS